MPQRTIQCVDPVMNAFQAPQAPPARPQSDKPTTADAQPNPPQDKGAEANSQAATPEPAPPQERHVTVEDMSGWAMGGSD